MRHGYREITGKSKHSLFKTQLLKWVFGTGTGASVPAQRQAVLSKIPERLRLNLPCWVGGEQI